LSSKSIKESEIGYPSQGEPLKIHRFLGKISLYNIFLLFTYFFSKFLSYTDLSVIGVHTLIKINSGCMGHTDIIDLLNSN